LVSVVRILSDTFTSNVYLVSAVEKLKEVYLIDCGCNIESIYARIGLFELKGIFITHYHYDHIYYIEDLISKFPLVKVYGSKETKIGLASAKKNLSFYHNFPIEIDVSKNFVEVKNNEEILMFDKLFSKILTTEGHCEGCISIKINNYVFTGDALIPNIPIVTKLKTGDKDKSRQSVEKLKNNMSFNDIVCPGHLEPKMYSEIDWEMYLK
jgi:glyoxylase-like metal-dependent hydrolase (beta-lactamase superfamily II)